MYELEGAPGAALPASEIASRVASGALDGLTRVRAAGSGAAFVRISDADDAL
jgi:hypothetical protein